MAALAAGERRRLPTVIGAVHLVWGPLGPAPLRRFLRSYREQPAGVEHELVVLMNGVSAEQRPAILAELDGVEHELLELPARLQDLGAYAEAARRLAHERLCFLNSFSVLLAPDWLAKLSGALDEPGVGLAGATGSWASLRSLALHLLRVPTPYRRSLPPRRAFFEEFQALERELALVRGREDEGGPELGALAAKKAWLRDTVEQIVHFDGFPAPHLRTNAFIAERALILRLLAGAITGKFQAYRRESGSDSLTKRAQALGLQARVVDRDGESHPSERWAQSETFWQGDQARLLISDNQTSSYANGDLARRRVLAALAWGRFAAPRIPEGAIG